MAPELLIGTSGWNYFDWKGRFYPENLKSRDYLAHFGKHFRTTEVNYSFYHLPKPMTYQNWASLVPEDFVFAVKASRLITHIRRLKDTAESWRIFLENASHLNKKLGPVLLQFPPSFRKDAALLDAFLQETRRLKGFKGLRLALEFRHASWFDREVCEMLEEHGCALVVAHSQQHPQAPFVPTASFVYLRLHGPGALFASSYSGDQLRDWAARVENWLASGRSVYVYFNNDFHGYAVENAKALTQLM